MVFKGALEKCETGASHLETRGKRKPVTQVGPQRDGLLVVIWWRRRESNPRPRAFARMLYMLSRLSGFNAYLVKKRHTRQTRAAV